MIWNYISTPTFDMELYIDDMENDMTWWWHRYKPTWHEAYLPELKRYFADTPLPFFERYPMGYNHPGYDDWHGGSVYLPLKESELSYEKFKNIFKVMGIGPHDGLNVSAFILSHEIQHHVQVIKGWMKDPMPGLRTWKGTHFYNPNPYSQFDLYIHTPWEMNANATAIDFCRSNGYLNSYTGDYTNNAEFV